MGKEKKRGGEFKERKKINFLTKMKTKKKQSVHLILNLYFKFSNFLLDNFQYERLKF